MSGGPRLVIVHNDQLVCEIVSFACQASGISVVGEVRTYDDVVGVTTVLRPEVVLIADRLGDALVEDVLDDLAETGSRLLVLSAEPSSDRMGHVLMQDVAGYLSYDAGPEDVAAGILAVARGEAALTPEVLTMILSQWRRLRSQPLSLAVRRRPTLTPRELDILTAMTEGLAAKSIATQLGVAIKTVENHKIRIFEKLGVRSHAHAVTVALAYGLARTSDACP